MESIVSYPDRNNKYGRNTYRGNCSGELIKDIIRQYKLKGLSDFMVGGGTTEDVVREMGIRGTFADLNRGYDMISMDIPERAENLFFHSPYAGMIVYSDNMYDTSEVEKRTGLPAETILANDLSRCKDWNDFVRKLNYCVLKQFSALDKGGRMFMLVGDWKQRGRLFSMILDILKPGTLEQIIIKAQHNTWSGRQTYSGNFVPIIHEYLIVCRKDDNIYIPVSCSVQKKYDMRSFSGQSWRDLVYSIVKESGGRMSLREIYDAVKDTAKAQKNAHWQEKVRQTLQNIRHFVRTERGCYTLAPAA